MLKPFLAAVALFGVRIIAAGVSGAAFGFANGTTGGGDAEALAPSDFSQLAAWLTDNTPRIILIDKEFDYLASEGECTDYKRRIPDSNTCGSAGQNAIDIEKLGWCDPYPSITCTYYKVPLDANDVTSNKSIVGVGIAGAIRERVGAWSMVLATLLVIQKIHITDLNPQDIWGGDTISLDGTDNVWIDHVEILLVGRQIFVSGRDPSRYPVPLFVSCSLHANTGSRWTCDYLQHRVRWPDQLVCKLRRPSLLEHVRGITPEPCHVFSNIPFLPVWDWVRMAR